MQIQIDNTDFLKGNVLSSKCPSRQFLQHFTSRWGLLTLVALTTGQKRFSELRREIDGISERMLAQTLQALEADGIIHRHDFHTIPPKVEYSLTPLGLEATAKIMDLVHWVEDNYHQFLAEH